MLLHVCKQFIATFKTNYEQVVQWNSDFLEHTNKILKQYFDSASECGGTCGVGEGHALRIPRFLEPDAFMVQLKQLIPEQFNNS